MLNFCPHFVKKSTVFCLYSINSCWISDSLEFFSCWLARELKLIFNDLRIQKAVNISWNHPYILQLQASLILRNSSCRCFGGWWRTRYLFDLFHNRYPIHQPASWLHRLPLESLSLTKQCCHKTALYPRALPFLHRCYRFNGHTESLSKAKIPLCQVPLGQDTSWCWGLGFFFLELVPTMYLSHPKDRMSLVYPGWQPARMASRFLEFSMVSIWSD